MNSFGMLMHWSFILLTYSTLSFCVMCDMISQFLHLHLHKYLFKINKKNFGCGKLHEFTKFKAIFNHGIIQLNIWSKLLSLFCPQY